MENFMLKKALLVGINNYRDYPLRGCVNDVTAMKDLLVELFGFSADNIRFITDRDATTKTVVENLEWLAQGGSDPAVRVFHYAGHGHFVPDKNGDEPDGSDEAMVLYDHDKSGYLIDDKLKELYDRFPANGNLTLIMDCCHSGTSQRGPEDLYYRLIPNTYEEREAIAAARRKFLQAQMQFVRQELGNLRSKTRGPDEELERQIMAVMQKFEKVRFGDHRVREGNILLAGCKSDQQAADAKMGPSKYHGAFTYYFIKLVREAQGKISHQDLMKNLGKALYDHKFNQEPQLECNEGREKAMLFSLL
jgi:metacaspase-1